MKRTIILASASPRRRELLEQIGLEFTVVPSQAEEVITKVLPNEIVEELSKQKAEEVAQRITGKQTGCEDGVPVISAAQASGCRKEDETAGTIVIGSDTIVWQDGRVMGKPRSREDAKNMLLGLQGNVHSVFTGVTVIVQDGERVQSHTFSRETKVHVYPMTEAEVEAYIETGDPSLKRELSAEEKEAMKQAGWMDEAGNWRTENKGQPVCMDKAGAYGIQNQFAAWVEGIEGDYNSVVGLPVSAVWQVLKEYIR